MDAIGIWLKKDVWPGINGGRLELKGHKTYTGGEKAGRKYLKQRKHC